jgi:ABC-type sugar transport system ATPase subunit
MASIQLDGVGKTFANLRALEPVSLKVEDGEFVALLGPSGCGKTTTLNIVAGLEEPSEGRVLIDGSDVTDIPATRRNLAMVFQSYALYPHLTVRQNIAFPLDVQKRPKAEIDAAVGRVAETLGLGTLLERHPRALSGGQRQRVALGRALVRSPRAFLFDEPLSNLDAVLRLQMREELSSLFRSLKATALYVTHDQAEAMSMADRIAVFRTGKLLQFAPPLEIYRAPADRFVAAFVGAPPMSFLSARVGDRSLHIGDLELPAPRLALSPGSTVEIGLRPETVRPSDDGPRLPIIRSEHLGGQQVVTLGLATARLQMVLPPEAVVTTGESIGIRIASNDIYVFHEETGRTLAAPGLTIQE